VDDPGPAAALTGARGEAVLGFGSLSPFRDKPAYATTVENSVYVARTSRQAGVGRAILGELIRLAQDHGFHAIIARTEGSNTASTNLHLACGFELVGVEREVGRKHGRWLDVVELQRML
jgi:phosphinothricin acetyltransferase